MNPNRLGYVALSAFSALFLLGCPTPVDMHDPDNNGGSTGSRGGASGSGTGGSGSGTGGSGMSSTGGTSGGTGGKMGSGGSGSGTGGSMNRGGSGAGGMARGGAGGGSMDAGGMEMAAATGTKVPANVQAVFMKCGTACHGGNWGDATKSYARLKMNAMCGNMPRMVVGMGASSLVVQKLKGAVAGCGARMPLNMPALMPAEIMTVEQWITDGAKPVP